LQVSSFAAVDGTVYSGAPRTPHQAFLRRPPPAGSPSLAERIARAEERTRPRLAAALAAAHARLAAGGPLRLGLSALTVYRPPAVGGGGARGPKRSRTAGSSAAQREQLDARDLQDALVAETLALSGSPEAAAGDRLTLELNALGFGAFLCAQAAAALAVARAAAAAPPAALPLRDHRTMPLAPSEIARIMALPPATRSHGACFRDLPGVAVGEDGTVCAGHTHSASCPAAAAARAALAGAAAGPSAAPARGLLLPELPLSTKLAGCASATFFAPSGAPMVPRCAVNLRKGLSRAPYGRMSPFRVPGTISCRMKIDDRARARARAAPCAPAAASPLARPLAAPP